MNRPTITVCIATYNQREYIEDCLRSVLGQKVDAEISILVGDDASDDGTSDAIATLAAAYPEKIQHLVRQPRLGAVANMRDLITRADGNFIARTDGDDYWLPGKLARQLAFLQAHPECSAVYTNAITVDKDGNRIGLFNDVGDERFDLPALLRRGNFLNNSSVLFRFAGRQAWLSVDVPQIDYRAHLWHACQGWLGHIGEPLTAYRVNTPGSMVSGTSDRIRELYWDAIQSVPLSRASDDDFAHGIADFMRRIVFRTIATRNWKLATTWWPRVRAASPYGALRTAGLVFASIMRIGAKILAGPLRRDRDGRRIRVLYPR
jgi:glycosyltransferase involved in cell wall biosynthesis